MNTTINSVSRLKAPLSKTSKAAGDENKENTSVGVKRKDPDAEQRDRLAEFRERKALGSTTTGVKTSLNSTLNNPAKVRKTTVAVAPTLSTTTRVTTKPGLPSAAKVKSEAANKKESAMEARLAATEAAQQKHAAKVEDLTSLVAALTNQVQDRDAKIRQVEMEKGTVQIHMEDNRMELQNVTGKLYILQQEMITMQERCNTQTSQILNLKTDLTSTTSQLNSSRAQNLSQQGIIDNQTGEICAKNAELTSVKSQLTSSDNLCTQKEQKIQGLLRDLDNCRERILELEAQTREDEATRKKLHNTIQELKGNIRVFCRIRPYLGTEAQENGASMDHYEYSHPSGKSLDINTSAITASGVTGNKVEGKKFQFGFDKVFKPESSQSVVFDEISHLVQSSLDGYNTCIFAYGQTGSGKTYTMEGPGIPSSAMDMPIVDESTQQQKGMIPRAVEQIWITAESLKDKGWVYEMEATYIEIYNETIKDLLAKKQVSDDVKYDIKHSDKGVTSITNVTTVKVRSPAQVYELLARASHNRSVGKTDMNERSSRSHSVFQLKLSGTNTITTESVNGLLNLIDLAGSERLAQSGATGQRLKETVHINKSLTHLGDVIAALANKDAHIPYRNSKLTYLLQNSLGGNSKTLMFVNISPRTSDLNETISSLRFATKVNACEIGTAKKQTKM